MRKQTVSKSRRCCVGRVAEWRGAVAELLNQPLPRSPHTSLPARQMLCLKLPDEKHMELSEGIYQVFA
jgi:hypothetical protein